MGLATNAPMGILIFTLGGLAAAVFYLPLNKVKNWAWESYWLVYALGGMLIFPFLLAAITAPNFLHALSAAPAHDLWYCFLCGAGWGIGGLTWGLMIRYLGVGLGLAMGAGLTSAVGTLLPPLFKGHDAVEAMFHTASGQVSVISAVVSLIGIIFIGMAGMSKEGELSEEEKKKHVAEFNFKKGLTVAIFSGILSSAMSFGLQGGASIQHLTQTLQPATSVIWSGMPVLFIVVLGGFVVNAGWCLFLNIRNKSARDYVNTKTSILPNILLALLAGALWCSQFACFKIGEPLMGPTSYVGWAVLMAAQILFSQIFGVFLGEWNGTGLKTRSRLGIGLFLLIVSACLAGYGPSLG